MNWWTRLLAALDAPRFCGSCGKPIWVENDAGYDNVTGERKPYWYWRCPEVRVQLNEYGGIRERSWFGPHSHQAGTGRPRWHRAQNERSTP